MQWLFDLFTNPFLMIPLCSWLLAQVIKTIVDAVVKKKWDFSRLFGDGGMPSAHSATVTSLAVVALLDFGPASFEFAFAVLFAVVVCRDAVGVRRETGKQAMLLNEVMSSIELLKEKDILPEVKLKELVGHTPLQVLFGTLIGTVNAVLMYRFVF